MAFVLLHIWVPFAHRGVRKLLQFQAIKDAEGNIMDPDVEDVKARSSLQQSLSELVRGYSDAMTNLHFQEAVVARSPNNKAEAIELEIRKREVQTYEDEFDRTYKDTGFIAHFALAFAGVAVVMVVYGWVWFDFFSDDYHNADKAQDYKQNSLERVWFGYISGFAFAVIVVPWVAALVAVYGMIKTLVTIAKARVRIFTAGCERAFDKAVCCEHPYLNYPPSPNTHTFHRMSRSRSWQVDTFEHASMPDDSEEEEKVPEDLQEMVSTPEDTRKGLKKQPSFHGELEELVPKNAQDSRKWLIRRKFGDLEKSIAGGCIGDEFVHLNVGFTEFYCEAAVLRDEVRSMFFLSNLFIYLQLTCKPHGQILLCCREWDALLSALIMVCLTLILLPVIHFTDSDGMDTANDDGTTYLEGVDMHYYLRDVFNIVVGVCACYLALTETASLTNECERCLEHILSLHKTKYWLPPLRGHVALREFMCSPRYTTYFGFTIMGPKIESKHIATFGYVLMVVFSAVGGSAAAS